MTLSETSPGPPAPSLAQTGPSLPGPSLPGPSLPGAARPGSGAPSLPPLPVPMRHPHGAPQIAFDESKVPSLEQLRKQRGPGFKRSFLGGWLRWRVIWMTVALAIVGVSKGGEFIQRQLHDDDAASSGQSAPKYPDAWDPRVQPFVTFVEQHRNLIFQHPVEVDFLAEADYLSLFEGGDGPTDDQRSAAEQYARTIDAQGLAGDYDPVQTQTTVAQTTTIGFYSFNTGAIYVRGSELTPAVDTVLVHELTHALQAQHFEIDLDTPHDLDIRAVVEGDAMRIEREYAETLPPDVQQQVDADNSADEDSEAQLADVPWALVESGYAPYVLGPEFLDVIGAAGGVEGNAAIDAVFSAFPTDEQLLSPETYSPTATLTATGVSAPPGALVIEEPRPWPMFDALVMLDAWLPYKTARDPFDGWAGGGFVSYQRGGAGGPACFSAAAAFDDDASATLFTQAITSWAVASGSTAIPLQAASQVTFEACERGAAATLPPKPEIPTSVAAVIEHIFYVGIDAVANDALPVRLCVARTLVDDPEVTPVFNAVGDHLSDEQYDILVFKGAVARNACTAPPA